MNTSATRAGERGAKDGREPRARRGRARSSRASVLGVVVALAAHAAAFVVAARIEVGFAPRVEQGEDEIVFRLDLRSRANDGDGEAAPKLEVDVAPTPEADGETQETVEPDPVALEPVALEPIIEPAPTPALEPAVPPELLVVAETTAVEPAPPTVEPPPAPVHDGPIAYVAPSEVGGGHAPVGPSPKGPYAQGGSGPSNDATKPSTERAPAARGSTSGSGSGATDLDAGDASSLRARSAPAPIYPAAARRAGRAGIVTCRLIVERDGRVSSVEVVASSGHADLDEAARSALLRWRFEPLGARSDASRVRVLQKLEFRLDRAVR